MTIEHECIGCLISQSRRVAEAIHADDALTSKIVGYVESALNEADYTLSPPVLAAPLYEEMARIADKTDLYDEQKRYASEQASSYLPYLKEAISKHHDPFPALLKTAVVGNVIDLAAEISFDLHEAITSVFTTDFAHDDSEKLCRALSDAQHVVYIGDNAGEHIFDRLAIQTLCDLFPSLHISYMVRGNPIINDVTMSEALDAGMDQICTLIDSGVNTPGFVYERANAEAKKAFDEADIIIAKGMGNYECMTPQSRGNICFLLKVKCSVVARSLKKEIGDIICHFE